MILLIDNYDSFSYNLFQQAAAIEPEIKVVRNDALTVSEIEGLNPSHIILSPGPGYPKDAGICEKVVSRLGGSIPILGVCLGHQAICEAFGGRIEHAQQLMHGKQSIVEVDTDEPLFKGLEKKTMAARYHSLVAAPDSLPDCLKVISRDEIGEIMAVKHKTMPIYGVQFHPEVMHTTYGNTVLKNFLYEICGAKGEWTMANFAQSSIEKLKQKIGDKKVLCALSGGVDSAVAATLVHKACPNLVCIFVDHGLLRKNEAEEVVRVFKEEQGMNLIKADASDRFLSLLKGVTDPEKKRKIIGAEFIKVINCARYKFFVAGNRRCRNNNGIARKNFNLFMVIIGHTG